ncbi:unnamed protein product [Orchesella dallaii]|uniref:Histone-lysine N-methyltransferase PRDM9 n=1 Tax=Orchesella dallaii TaxID=48710 RepID=A0ABP1S9C2_9HEXA
MTAAHNAWGALRRCRYATVRKLNDHVLQGRETFLYLREQEDSKQIKRKVDREQYWRRQKAAQNLNCHEINAVKNVSCLQCEMGENCDTSWYKYDASLPHMEIFETETMGKGVRATARIKKGEFVGKYIGKLSLTKPPRDHLYVVELGQLYVDAEEVGSVSRYFNSSCDPNLQLERWSVGKWPLLLFFAIKHIDIGEELTYNYLGKYNVGNLLVQMSQYFPRIDILFYSFRFVFVHVVKKSLTVWSPPHSSPSPLPPPALLVAKPPQLTGNPPPTLTTPPLTVEKSPQIVANPPSNNAKPPLKAAQLPTTLAKLPKSSAKPLGGDCNAPKKLACKIEGCNRGYSQQKWLTYHVKHDHNPHAQVWKCSQCKRVYTSKGTLTKHLKVVHKVQSEKGVPIKNHFCIHCNLKYTRRKDVYAHIRLKHGNIKKEEIQCCCGKRPGNKTHRNSR